MKESRDTTQRDAPTPIDKLYLENTLLRVSGALFCHDPKRAAGRTDEIVINAGVPEKEIVVRPDPQHGQPGQLAHKIFVALLKKHSDYGKPAQADISFSKRELIRLVGRREWGGRDSEELSRALHEIHYTFVRTHFRTSDGRAAEHSFSVFPEIYLERAEFASDPIEKCTVTLARPIIASLNDDHFTCLNYALMQELGTIGQALYMRLFFHFSTLYDGHHRSRLNFPKRYDDICEEWLGGLTVHAHKSVIERDQLGPHLRDLIRVGFLASYTIAKARSGHGLVLTFRPGATFFADYDRFYRHRAQGDLQFQFHVDRAEVVEPLKVAYLFLEKRSGKPLSAIPYVSSKEVDTARQLLAAIPFSQIADFFDFGLAEAKKTNFDVQALGGLRQYLDRYLETRQARAADRHATEGKRKHERREAQLHAYETFRAAKADELLAGLPTDEQAAIEERAREQIGPERQQGPLAKTILKAACRRMILERHPAAIPSLEQWRSQQR